MSLGDRIQPLGVDQLDVVDPQERLGIEHRLGGGENSGRVAVPGRKCRLGRFQRPGNRP